MTNQETRWPNQGMPMNLAYNRQNPPVLPPPATLEAGGQQFPPFTSLPALGSRGSTASGHVFLIPAINSSEDLRLPPAGARLPQVPGYGALSSHLPNSIYNLTHQNEQLPPDAAPKPQHSQPQSLLQLPQNTGGGVQPPLPEKPAAAAPQPAPAQDTEQAREGSVAADQQGAQNLLAIPHGVMSRSSASNAYRPLNVKDALSYLDQVKIQFYNQTDVYNNFLDIMKDFKSQSIDTPGVIDRVSSLFRGHPNLIQGFNTFLPPGYKIECSLDPSDPNPIRVTTPTGTTTRPNFGGVPQFAPAGPPQQWADQGQPAQPAQFPQDPQHLQAGAGGQIEFNHAISYVNKIKTRFANQPDIYKQFLEILQTYQREQKPIGEVYEQVTQLFANSPDLLSDFKQFLPDTGNHQPQFAVRAEDQVLPQQAQPQLHGHDGQAYYATNGSSQLPPLGNFQPNASGGVLSPDLHYRHFQPNVHETDQTAPMVQHPLRKNSEHRAFESNYNEEASYSGIRGAPQVGPTKQKSATPSSSVMVAKTNPTLVAGIPEPVPPSYVSKTSSLLEELSFFDKVKKAIGNKQTYNEFLKMLNLFSQDIIDKETLVERVESFLGDNNQDLTNWFKQFVGYEKPTQHMEDITFRKHQIELSLCKSYGPSYRQLPKVETYMPCSGRDEMCWEVLNDELVGHPTWASEDSGFISHRKNQYEEILFKIEEERLEFDYHMEANLRTIQTLETIANRIANMTPEQKASFKLPPGLGHTSQTIYKKVIRKIYDKDRGFEVIDALHQNPAVAVPVVLKRLKQKDEEWKRSQREWNKVWREMEQKVFYKSLDHLGLTFKQADKKLLTAKQLVSEISTVKVEQQNKRVHPLTPKPQEQLNYNFTDDDVIFDVIKLAEFYIYHSSNYSLNDRDKLGSFFKYFISLLFGIPTEKIYKALEARYSRADQENANDKNHEDYSNITDSNGNGESNSGKKRAREQDLLRDVLKKQSKSRKEESEDAPSSGSEDSRNTAEKDAPGDLWINTTSAKFSLEETEKGKKRDKFNFFCHTTAYVFFRHFRTLYERLLEIKGMEDDVEKEIRSRKFPQFAKDLNLVSHQLQELGVEIVAGSKACYHQVLRLAERLLDGEIEHQWFEESLRQAYRNKAYKCYTLDKVVQSLVKHMHTMVSDSKTSDMIVLFEEDRHSPTTTAKNQILYRMKARALMSTDENMFKISFQASNNSVNIQFVGLDDLTINDHTNSEEKYNYYVTSYIMSHPTEGVPMSKISMPFHKNFINSVDEDQCNGLALSQLKVSICENSYRLFFEAETCDKFISNSMYSKQKDTGKSKTEKLEILDSMLNDKESFWNGERNNMPSGESEFKLLVEKGAKEYKNALRDQENHMNDIAEKAKAEKPNFETAEMINGTKASKPHPDVTIDADSTLVQEHNDTTIQQEANDDTMEDVGGIENGVNAARNP
ncbi:hypothetical protein METBIDRAFT_13404 [Metschnikowia bicuspidata var. bicuspidata NRRL YB-4993]|uniref:Histone deacetylase interacting domain-containing protein n=1 Tax=Metschnikowia bicuspidata var. bicuspidata NRRL YB-4993 TaxID=869754 RepID=A0A1A0H6Y0_9ASCO|nr:hypothetical protein METBIDRAFT_13404 [Metschnikowia bicuspidata var. bicuspidata NRRL YB-4993]OBA19663.1 hypothetical protein METBIDRAFT_13404 [Metschnikowia bicuspidata var. bicuspidata NRRL YB-4993]